LEDSFLSVNFKPGQQEFDFRAWVTRWGVSYKSWVLQNPIEKQNPDKPIPQNLLRGAVS
jgi:hypothetical protein